MENLIVMHVDEVPYVRGGPTRGGESRRYGFQFIGDVSHGPWIHVITVPPNFSTSPHSHGEDEVLFILDGSIEIAGKSCQSGTIIFVRKGAEYSFTAGEKGARFLNIRSGLATVTRKGVESNPYQDLIEWSKSTSKTSEHT